ncbi:MAG: SemiSWEET transporter [Elusimicrobia bacterium]|nr:SemiSWEET transporter [Candidatus Liberimonas magnetica]
MSFYIGIIAGILCTISFIPQVYVVIKTRNTKDLSLTTFTIFAIGVFLWFIYGLLIHEMPVIIANLATLVMIIIIIIMKIKHG